MLRRNRFDRGRSASSASWAGTEVDIIVGASRTGSFVADADRRAFDNPTLEPRLPALIAALEASEKPVAAARARGRDLVETG